MVESFLVIYQFFNVALNIMHMLFVLHIHNEIYIRMSYVNEKTHWHFKKTLPVGHILMLT